MCHDDRQKPDQRGRLTTLTVPGTPNRADAYALAQQGRTTVPAPVPVAPDMADAVSSAQDAAPATAPAADAADPAAPTEPVPAGPPPKTGAKTRAEIDAELGLPPAETGLAPPPPVAGSWDVIGAAWRAETIKTDAWNDTVRRKVTLLDQMIPLLDAEARGRIFATRGNPGPDRLAEKVIAEANRMAAASVEDAQRWTSFPRSKEEFDRTIDEGRRADLDEAQALLDQPGGGFSEFLGAGARAMTDEYSLALLPFGLTGSAWRMIAGEAILGGIGEVPSVIKETRVAGELELPDPDAASRIAMGAVFGGGFSAAIIGLGKGARALTARVQARRASLNETIPTGVDRIDHEAGVEAAEAKLRGDQTVQERLGGGEQKSLPGTLGDILNDPAPGVLPPVTADAPEGWTQIRNGIFAGESGGDYNALYGYQNRKGGKFANVRLTEMTVDQAIAFSAPSGPYGQWVKNTIGRVATPMGAYQIVGTTLRAAKKALGLKGDEVMTPELQEFLGQWIYRQQGTSAWEGYRGPRDSFSPGSVDGPAPPLGPTSRGYTGENQIAIDNENRIDVEYEVVDYSSLIRASGDLQPRDRSTAASDVQVAKIAAALDPARLMRSAEASTGAPIVGPDNVIESGNGRWMAIGRAAELHPDRYQAYRDAIVAEGFVIPEGVQRPVLIARRKTDWTPEQRRKNVVRMNYSNVAMLNPVETAAAHNGALTPAILDRFDRSTDLSDVKNAEFARAALSGLPDPMQQAMFDENVLNSFGRRTIREMIFARAWQDRDIIELFTENERGDFGSLLDALGNSAPEWAALKADIERGLVATDMDISGYITDAIRFIAVARKTARRDGQTLANVMSEFLNTPDMLEGTLSPPDRRADPQVLAERPRGQRRRGHRLFDPLRQRGPHGRSGGRHVRRPRPARRAARDRPRDLRRAARRPGPGSRLCDPPHQRGAPRNRGRPPG